jgi:hypothetical protein
VNLWCLTTVFITVIFITVCSDSADGLYATGDSCSPIIHLQLKNSDTREEDEALLQRIVDKV